MKGKEEKSVRTEKERKLKTENKNQGNRNHQKRLINVFGLKLNNILSNFIGVIWDIKLKFMLRCINRVGKNRKLK